MQNVKKYILKQLSSGNLSQKDAVVLLKELQGSNSSDIAIIGMSCRLPMANTIDEFWDNLISGRCCFSTKPPEKSLQEQILKNPHYAELLEAQYSSLYDKLESIIGAYIQDYDKFDPDFFNISPREARYIDPAQRVFLELAWAALEDAGYSSGTINDTKTGVFVGKDYSNSIHYKLITAPDPMKVTGTWEGLLASRLSYAFNLTGPTMVIDTACSSGLVAVHEACNALRNGECSMALAGGLSIGAGGASTDEEDSTPETKKEESDNGGTVGAVSSNDNRVRTFDKKCSGSVFGEGIVVFLLKPYDAAIKDHDHVYAVIKGSAINNDGASNGITAPNPLAQAAVITEAWKRAGINPEAVNYIEAHGTGTLLGDPIEILGIKKAFEKQTKKKQFCGIGSVKTNIGHLVAASGCASLMKVSLALQNQVIPPSINFEEPNQNIDFVNSPIYVVDKLTEWKRKDSKRCAGINAFGFSGTNCHVIVEEVDAVNHNSAIHRKNNIITFSAKTESSLRGLITKYCDFLKIERPYSFEDVCYTANACRGQYNYRLAVLTDNLQTLRVRLEALAANNFDPTGIPSVYLGKHKIVSKKYTKQSESELTEQELYKLSVEAQAVVRELAGATEYDPIKLEKLAELYSKGAGVDWRELYKGEEHYKVSLPSYAFDRISYWADTKITKLNSEDAAAEQNTIHPVIDRVLASSYDETIYQAAFNLEKHWFVKEHKIMGSNIVPGTAYIEVIKAACKNYFNTDQIGIKSLTFIQPLVVGADPVKAHIILKKNGSSFDFIVATRQNENDEKWIVHAEGTCMPLAEKSTTAWNVLDYDKEGTEVVIPIPEDETDDLVYMGPRWHCIEHIYKNGDILQSEVRLNERFVGDLKSYEYHPSMADAALNIPLQVYINNEMYLPLNYRGLRIYGKLPSHFFSKLEKLSGGNGSQTMSFKVTLADENSNILAEIDEYTTKKVGKFNSYVSNTYYGMQWEKVHVQPTEGYKVCGNVVIFTDGAHLAEDFAEKLTDAARVIFVTIGDRNETNGENRYLVDGSERGYNKLFDELGLQTLDHVFHFAGVHSIGDEVSPATNSDALRKTVYSLFLFSKVMLRRISGRTSFYVFGEAAHVITPNDNVKPISNAFLSLLKTLSPEYTNITFRGFDLSGSETAENIYHAVASADQHLIIALRDNQYYAEVLEEKDVSQVQEKPIKCTKEGVYLITGGTGGLGLEIARYLAEVGAGTICLLARRELPGRDRWEDIIAKNRPRKTVHCIKAIMELESKNIRVIIKSADVRDLNALQVVVNELISEYGRIAGIVHCAGVAGDGFLYNKSMESFNEVIEPKIIGSVNLMQATQNNKLDFFVMFSSMQSAIGGTGQGDYTAANAFMDMYASYLRRHDVNAKTINWPGWKETGMAVEYNVADMHALFVSLTTKKALIAFDYILHHDISNVMPGEIDYEFVSKFGDSLPFELSTPIKKAVERFRNRNAQKDDNKKTRRFNPDELVIHGKTADEYTDIEKIVALTYAAVLDINEIDIYENINSMGGDSIVAAEVLKQLNTQFNEMLNISDMFTYPCVFEMAEHITSLMNKQ